MTGTVLWLIAIGFIVVGLLVYFWGILTEERRKAAQQEAVGGPIEDETKEVIIDSLTSSDSYQRRGMAALLADFETVDDVILNLLKEMAESDEDEGARETAVATLKTLTK